MENATMSTPHTKYPNVDQLAEAALRWHGWGSPVGLGVFIVCLALAGLIAAQAVGTFTRDSGRGTHTMLQAPDGRH